MNFRARGAVQLPALVHQQIRSLEAQLGAQLFARNGNRLSLTEAGQTLLPVARQMVSVSMRRQKK